MGCAEGAALSRTVYAIRKNATEDSMPKLKTHRGAAKRFKVTGSGKIRRTKAYANHILTKKNAKRKRNLRKSCLLDKTDQSSVRKLIPYL